MKNGIFEKFRKISKNAFFRQFLEMDSGLHICCHGNDLSNITNWQHIGRRPSGRNFCRNFCLPLVSELNFHLWRRFFSSFDKISNFWQQKQHLLFSSNMTPKVCCQKFLGSGTPSWPQETFKLKKTPFFGVPCLKKAPHRAQEGRNFCEKIIFFGNN